MNKRLLLSLLFVFFAVVKITQGIYLSDLTTCRNPETKAGSIALFSGDTFSYTGAMENYIQTGLYHFYYGGEKAISGRLPHSSIPFFFFRQVFSFPVACDLSVFLQLILQIVATCVLLIFFHEQFKNWIASSTLFILFLIESNWTHFSILLLPESLGCSFLVLFIVSYGYYRQQKTHKMLLLAGLFLGLLITMKPYYIVLFLPVGIAFLLESKKSISDILRNAVIQSTVVALPFILLVLPWTVRNYKMEHQFIPLQVNLNAGYYFSEAYQSFKKFVSAWGGDFINWEPKSAGCYFLPMKQIPCDFRMPAYAFCKGYGQKEVEDVRKLYIQFQNDQSDSLNHVVANRFKQMTTAFISEKPFRYHFLSRIHLMAQFLVHSGSYYLPIHVSNPCFSKAQMGIKIAESASYWLSLTFGVIGLILLTMKTKNLVFAFLPIFLVVLFPIVLRAAEQRYFRTVEPILYMGVAYFMVMATPWLQGIVLKFKPRTLHN